VVNIFRCDNCGDENYCEFHSCSENGRDADRLPELNCPYSRGCVHGWKLYKTAVITDHQDTGNSDCEDEIEVDIKEEKRIFKITARVTSVKYYTKDEKLHADITISSDNHSFNKFICSSSTVDTDSESVLTLPKDHVFTLVDSNFITMLSTFYNNFSHFEFTISDIIHTGSLQDDEIEVIGIGVKF
jgi:hypothetical protein